MNWNHPILTDSGGFQVFSLGAQKTDGNKLVTIDEQGATFRSHIDGSTHRFTPETAIDIQYKIGADIIMAFDESTPDTADFEYTKEAMNRTHRWAERCLKQHQQLAINNQQSYRQYLFGIIQGANHKELREESAKIISAMDFDGIAIGGGGFCVLTPNPTLRSLPYRTPLAERSILLLRCSSREREKCYQSCCKRLAER
jgi:queuine tRNA-ribosyltransferase